MRIRELLRESSEDEIVAQILTVLDFLRNRDHNKKLLPDHSTAGVINMINNIIGHSALTYDLFASIKDSNPEIGNLITNMDKDHMSLLSFGDEPGAPEEPADTGDGGGNAKDPTKIVDAMAKKAAANRS
jgi:hypothetical protein